MARKPIVERVKLSHFLGIKSGDVPLTRFTVLLGLNGSGKTTILEAMYMAANLHEGFFIEKVDPIGRSPLIHIFRRHGYPVLETSKIDRSLSLATKEVVEGEASLVFHMTRMILGHPRWLNYQSADLSEIRLISPLTEMSWRKWVEMLRAVLMDPETGEEAERLLASALSEESHQRIAAWMEEIYGLGPFRISFKKGEDPREAAAWVVFEHGPVVPISGMGDGIRAAFQALGMLEALGEGLFLWDGPEVHQHTHAIPRLMKVLADALTERDGLQIVLATQSLEILKALRDIFMERSDPEVFSMVFLRRDVRTGELEAPSFSLEDLDLMLQTERDPRTLLFGRRAPEGRGLSDEAIRAILEILSRR